MKKIIILSIIILFFQTIKSQTVARENRFQIGIVPHYMIFDAACLSFDILTTKRSSIEFNPRFYYNTETQVSGREKSKNEEITGGGASLGYRFNLAKVYSDIVDFNIITCVDYSGINKKYWDYAWQDEIVDEHIETKYRYLNIEEKIHRYSFSMKFENQININKSAYISAYIGLGMVYSKIKTNYLLNEYLNYNLFDLEYSGVFFPIGCKIGVKF